MRFFFNRQSEVKDLPPELSIVEERLDVDDGSIDKEIAAVIALSIHLHLTMVQEYEDARLTIQNIMKPYSPWSSKIYGLRQQPLFIPNLRSRLK